MGFLFADPNSPAKSTRDKRRENSIEMMHELGCQVCPLNTNYAENPDMDPDGSDEPLVYFLGEAPGELEDKKGKPFVGKAGKLLKKAIPREFKQDVRYNNIVRTRPPSNATPKWKEIECCKPSIVADIEKTRPVSIVCLGSPSLEWLIGQGAKILAWRGRRGKVKVGEHHCWLYPVFHPSYVLRMTPKGERPLRSVSGDAFVRDIKRVFDEVEDIPEAECEEISEDGIHLIETVDEWAEALKSLWNEDYVAFDLETHKLRPFDKQAKLLSIAVGTREGSCAVPVRHPEKKWSKKELKQIYDLFEDFLLNSKPVKVAHNEPFDLEWMVDVYGEYIAHEVEWGCSQAQAYILDQRAGCQSLDALCQLYFGVFLKDYSDIDVTNLINEPLTKVLRYNALDVKYTHRLFLAQKERIEEQRRSYVYENQIRRNKTLVLAQLRGVRVDTDASKELEDFCEKEIERLEKEINKTEGAIEYYNRYNEKLNPNSPPQLIVVFRDILSREEGWRGYKYSTDEEALTEMQDEPLARLVLDYRAYSRLLSTFIRPIKSEEELLWWDGKIHTSYKPYFVITGRLSSREPNNQNWPIRKFPWIRKQVIPDEDCVFVGGDYGQIEARCIAMASQDENYIEALWNHHDVHMDWAKRLAHDYPKVIGGKKFLEDEEAMDEWRSRVKNEWTFPLFYGSDADNCVRRTGIPKSIIYKHYDAFWDEFSGVKRWQEDLFKSYDELGYVESLTGRRYYYPLNREKITNYPTQGVASDITINAMDQLSEAAHQEANPELQALLNVHDDLTFCISKSTIQDTTERILDTMLFPEFDWISVPISVDIKKGSSWYDMKKVGTFNSDDW